MIRINLLPKEERIAAPRLSLPALNSMVPVAVLGGVILVVGITAVLERAKVASLNRDVVELREEVRTIQPQVDRRSPFPREHPAAFERSIPLRNVHARNGLEVRDQSSAIFHRILPHLAQHTQLT